MKRNFTPCLINFTEPRPEFYRGPIADNVTLGSGLMMSFRYEVSENIPCAAPNTAEGDAGYNAVVVLSHYGKELDSDYRFAYLSDGEPSQSEKEVLFRDAAIEVLCRNWDKMRSMASPETVFDI